MSLEVIWEILLPKTGSAHLGQPITQPEASASWPVLLPVASYPQQADMAGSYGRGEIAGERIEATREDLGSEPASVIYTTFC